MDREILLPKLGESIIYASISKMLKKVGQKIDKDEALFEVSTDKVNSEIPSPFSGFLKKVLVEENQEVKVGDVIAIISSSLTTLEKSSCEIKIIENIEIQKEDVISNKTSFDKTCFDKTSLVLSPVVRKIIKEKQISIEDLKNIKGTGAGGRISKKDLLQYLNQLKEKTPIKTVKMSSLRKKISQNMLTSIRNIPQASLITEIDVTELKKFITEQKVNFLNKNEAKLTITSFIIKAISASLEKFPFLNAKFLNDDEFVLNDDINIGIAVDVKEGVIVPVIKSVQNLSIEDIAKKLSKLAKNARGNTLSIKDIENGTITLTNYGISGIEVGFPIIKHPEVAIIGVGAIVKKLLIFDDDSIKIRSIMKISLTFDHRIVDGIYSCNFLKEIKENVQSDTMLQIL
jgi:2-oxoglutarate dehydrogenase E2 component (dihydrolipoamide succinyltransferase)